MKAEKTDRNTCLRVSVVVSALAYAIFGATYAGAQTLSYPQWRYSASDPWSFSIDGICLQYRAQFASQLSSLYKAVFTGTLNGTDVHPRGCVIEQRRKDNNAFEGQFVPNPLHQHTTALPWDPVVQKNNGSRNCVGNPINAANGNKVQVETDYVSSILTFRRSYNSRGIGHRALGTHWDATYFTEVIRDVDPTKVSVTRSDGMRFVFTLVSGSWRPDADVSDRLTEIKDGAGNTTAWKYSVASDDSLETYDPSGKLLSIASRAGVTQTLAYSTSAAATEVAPAVGMLIGVSDPFGHQLALRYDIKGRIVKITDPSGGEYQYAYDSVDNLTSVIYPGGQQRTYVYNEPSYTSGTNLPSALTGIVDESSVRYAIFKYDTQGRAISTEHASGADLFSVSYGTGASSSVVDPLGTLRNYSFQTLHNVFRTTGIDQPCGSGCGTNAQSIGYDANGNVASKTDFNGNFTSYVHDSVRNLETSRTEAYGTARARTITTTWHSTFRLPTQIDEPGKRTTFTHDSSGNVLTKTVLDTSTSESRTWTYTYNSFGQVLTADGPRTDVSDITTYTYYNCTTGSQCGQVQTITNAAGHVTTYNTYNAHGQPLTITDPNGLVTTLTYDARQRLTSRTVGTEQTTFDYWPTGLLKKVTQPDSSYLQYTYDNAHRLTEIKDSENNRIAYTLDNMGNRTAENVYDPSNVLTQKRTRVFNTVNQLWKELGAAGTAAVTTTFSYDNNSNQTGINAPLSRNTVQGYDELNRLTQVTDPLSGITQYGYNALDQLISVTDPRSKITSYTYNALGDLTQQVSPDTGTTASTYDSGGNLATSTDARSKTGTYVYDALNRPTSLTYPDQTISYTYDSGTNQKGRLTQVSDASGSTSWSYDTQGRVLSRQQSMGITKTLGYAYDSNGRLQTLTLPSGNTITYGYTNGRVTSLTLNGSTTILSNVLYEPFGPTRGWTWGNSTLAIREYDTDGKVTDIDSAGLKTYSYDNAFRITQITDAANSSLTQSYGYDPLDRLTSATGTSLNQGWTYDANDNRLTQTGGAASTYTVSTTSNRLSSVSGALTRTYGYDSAGSTSSDGTATFAYNDAGRMVSATKASVTTTYALNALGQRVKKTTSSSSTYFVYDETGHLVGEYDNSGNLIQETVWFGDAPVATLRPNGASVSLFYIHTDHLNTPRRITRPSDNVVVWRWDSDPFGTTAANQDPDGDSNALVFSLRFPGQYFDSETGLHYNYMRTYDPATGGYTQSDPIGLLGGINTYRYVWSNPLRYVDPFGLDVSLCKQPAFGVSWNPIDHYWIKTDTVEAGMGGTRGNEPGNQSGDRPGDPVQVTDHTGRSKQKLASCEVVKDVDEKKVNDMLKIGRPLGKWGPTNQCQSFARGVLEKARTTPPDLYPFDQSWLWGY
jgi:RHS repeat-associated protein